MQLFCNLQKFDLNVIEGLENITDDRFISILQNSRPWFPHLAVQKYKTENFSCELTLEQLTAICDDIADHVVCIKDIFCTKKKYGWLGKIWMFLNAVYEESDSHIQHTRTFLVLRHFAMLYIKSMHAKISCRRR